MASIKQSMKNDDDAACDVCRSKESEPHNQIVFCDKCDVGVHQTCYGISKIPKGDWFCDTCEKGARAKCIFCPFDNGAMKQSQNGNWAHVSCTLWIPEVSFSDPENRNRIIGINNIPKSRWSLICSLCRKRNGACIQCYVKSCKIAYHVTCAYQYNLHMEMEDVENSEIDIKVESFCLMHTNMKKQGVDPTTGNNSSKRKSKTGIPADKDCSISIKHIKTTHSDTSHSTVTTKISSEGQVNGGKNVTEKDAQNGNAHNKGQNGQINLVSEIFSQCFQNNSAVENYASTSEAKDRNDISESRKSIVEAQNTDDIQIIQFYSLNDVGSKVIKTTARKSFGVPQKKAKSIPPLSRVLPCKNVKKTSISEKNPKLSAAKSELPKYQEPLIKPPPKVKGEGSCVCSLCYNRSGVFIQCSMKGCRKIYHETCAIQHKLDRTMNQTFCLEHSTVKTLWKDPATENGSSKRRKSTKIPVEEDGSISDEFLQDSSSANYASTSKAKDRIGISSIVPPPKIKPPTNKSFFPSESQLQHEHRKDINSNDQPSNEFLVSKATPEIPNHLNSNEQPSNEFLVSKATPEIPNHLNSNVHPQNISDEQQASTNEELQQTLPKISSVESFAPVSNIHQPLLLLTNQTSAVMQNEQMTLSTENGESVVHINQTSSAFSEKNNYEAFSRYIATLLRPLPYKKALRAQRRIIDIVLKEHDLTSDESDISFEEDD